MAKGFLKFEQWNSYLRTATSNICSTYRNLHRHNNKYELHAKHTEQITIHDTTSSQLTDPNILLHLSASLFISKFNVTFLTFY